MPTRDRARPVGPRGEVFGQGEPGGSLGTDRGREVLEQDRHETGYWTLDAGGTAGLPHSRHARPRAPLGRSWRHDSLGGDAGEHSGRTPRVSSGCQTSGRCVYPARNSDRLRSAGGLRKLRPQPVGLLEINPHSSSGDVEHARSRPPLVGTRRQPQPFGVEWQIDGVSLMQWTKKPLRLATIDRRVPDGRPDVPRRPNCLIEWHAAADRPATAPT